MWFKTIANRSNINTAYSMVSLRTGFVLLVNLNMIRRDVAGEIGATNFSKDF